MNKIRNTVLFTLIIWALFAITSFASTGKINTDGARMRREPNTTSDVLTIVYNNEDVEILEKESEWYKVKYGEHTGYIREDLIDVEGNNSNNTTQEEPEDVKEENVQEQDNDNSEQNNNQDFVEVEKSVKKNTYAKILPILSASNVSELKQGEKVTVLSQMNKWSCISVNGLTAWVITNDLESITNYSQTNEGNNTQNENTQDSSNYEDKTMYISVSAAVLRSAPSTSSDAILEMHRGDEISILDEDDEWYKIKYKEQEGYVAKRLVSETYEETHRSLVNNTRINTKQEEQTETIQTQEKEEEEEIVNLNKGEEVVEYAKQFLGYKYVYGGAGTSGFDCSGFTQYVYKKFGISLAHSAVSQASSGTYVTKANLQAGDLVIFKDWDNNSIGHCGIYIGGGNFIHAANSKRGVVTDTLNSGYYYERYVSGRRLF